MQLSSRAIDLPDSSSSRGAALARELPGDFGRIGIVSDHLRVSYANGSSFASQFLRREFARRGHEVTLLGPADPGASPSDLPPDHIALPSHELRNHPGVFVPFPGPAALRQAASRRFDVLLGQTASGMVELGAWLRQRHHVPYLCVNTWHLPSAYNVLLPDWLLASAGIRRLFEERVIPSIEASIARSYNASDGLIVLSEGMRKYWLSRGITAPISVIPRSIEPKIFDRQPMADPFDVRAKRGGRLLVLCRHTREKGLERVLRIFAERIAPRHAQASLTLVGDGPDHDSFRQLSERLGVAARVFFPGEQPLFRVPDFYRHADLFLYTSLSDTYGQVVSEALWCGLPCVALADGMGVSQQISHGVTGLLVDAELSPSTAEQRFAMQVLELLEHPERRRAMGAAAAANARHRSAPERCVARYYEAFAEAREHMRESVARGEVSKVRPRLVSWALTHALLIALGYLRRRAIVNRNQSLHPGWGETLDGAAARSSGGAVLVESCR
jgi:1,2-diacylglycerol 3-alpha-glucosyltransferase